MAIEWQLAEKVIGFVLDLPAKDRWELAVGALTLSIAVLGIGWKIALVIRGRNNEKLQTQLNDLLVQIMGLRGNLNKKEEEIQVLNQSIEITKANSTELPTDVQDVLRIREELVRDSSDVWGLRNACPLAHLRERLVANGTKIITIGNLKGGVGKTTITSNLAAFFDRELGKRVLVIDLDYQGSVSATMLRAAGKGIETSLTEYLLTGEATGKLVVEIAKDLVPALNNTHIIPAGYTLAAVEEQLMLRWLFHTTDRDVRFNLAEVLLSKEVQQAYQIILMDVGPRLTTASISALCASTHLIVPTNLDTLSAETIGSFLNRVKSLKDSMGLAIELAGVVGTMSFQDRLTPDERETLSTIHDGLEQWGPGGHIFDRTIPRRRAFETVAGTNIGYLKDRGVRSIFQQLGYQVATRIKL